MMKRKLKQPQSPLACQACRAKKIRCDLSTRKTTCSKCSQRGIVCVIVPGRRRHLVDRMLKSVALEQSTIPTQHSQYDDGTISPHLISSPSTIESMTPGSIASLASAASSATSNSSYEFLEERIKLGQDLDVLPDFSWTDELPTYDVDQQYNELKRLGCFDMPDDRTRETVLEAYRNWIHPMLPLLDLQQLAPLAGEDSGPSPLLLKSVMMVVSPLTEFTYTQDDLRRQVQALIRANIETDPVVELQALILLSRVEPGPADVEDEYHWVSQASEKASQILLSGIVEEERKETLSAALWSLLIQDTLVALTKRKPCQVQISLPRYGLITPPPDTWFGFDLGDNPEHSARSGRGPRELCRGLGELCMIIRPVLAQGPCYLASVEASLAQSLSRWGQKWIPRARSSTLVNNAHLCLHWTSIVSAWSLANLTFFCRSSDNASDYSTASINRATVSNLVGTAISVTTELLSLLHARSLVQFAPGTTIAALAPVTAAHLMNTTSEMRYVRQSSSQKYFLCWTVLRELRTRSRHAAMTMSMIDTLGQRVRRTFDTTKVDQEEQLRTRTMSMSTSSPASLQEAVTPSSAMDDQAWLEFLSGSEDLVDCEAFATTETC